MNHPQMGHLGTNISPVKADEFPFFPGGICTRSLEATSY